MALQLVQQTTIGLNQEALDEWIAYRAEDKKKPMTPRAIKMTIKFLLEYPEAEQDRLVCHAIRNNWEGIHWVEPPKVSAGRPKDRDLMSHLTDMSWAN